MNTEKANKKLSSSVAAYLTHKGIGHSVSASLTFAELAGLQDVCDPLALEPQEARAAAYSRLAVLGRALEAGEQRERPLSRDALEEKARSLINPLAIAAYAGKRGAAYRDWVAHKVAHPRGKSPLELAECYMKLGEIDIAIKGLTGESAERVRNNAITNAKKCLMAIPA